MAADAGADPVARHQRVKRIFLEALESPRGKRGAAVAAACAGDEELHREVLELFLLHGEPDDVLDEPVDGTSALAGFSEDGETHVGPYRLLDVLGRGGMGVVHRAERDGGEVALKVLAAGSLSPELRERFRLEAAILQRLDHPGLARVIEVGEAPGPGGVTRPWIAMELVLGHRLLDHARAAGLSFAARLRLMAEVADAVQHAHARGVVHRDLKPGNILVRTDGRPVVLDFGIARMVVGDERPTELLTRTGQIVGTPQYMSPEQVQAEPAGIGPPSDVYALGMILYELLTGRAPYDASSVSLHRAVVSILTCEPPPLGKAAPELRGATERIVGCALEKDPRLRYPDAGAFADDLRRRLDGRPIRAHGPGLARRFVRWSRRRQRLAAALAALVVLLALVGALFLGTRLEVPRERVLATYREAETLVSQASSILYQRERSADGMRQVVDMLTRARTMIGEVPSLRHHATLLRALEKDLGTAYMLLAEMTWDVGAARQAIMTIEHAYRIPQDTVAAHEDDRQVPYLGDPQVAPADLLSLLAGAQLVAHRLWGEPDHLHAAMNLARRTLAEDARLVADERAPAPPRAARLQHIGYDYNSLAAIGTELALFGANPDAARTAIAWSDSAWERRESFRHEWPAYGSLLFERGRAHLVLGELTGSGAALDTAAVYLRACVDYRGPERPRTHSETRETLARLALIRARLGPAERRPELLRTSLRELAAAHEALGRTPAAAAHLAWLRAEQASPFVELALATRDPAALDSARSRLAETENAFPPTSLPRQASVQWVRSASVRLAQYALGGNADDLSAAREDLAHARLLARARNDSLVIALVARVQRDLPAPR